MQYWRAIVGHICLLSQKIALDQAFRSKISIIEGPPGTGKTQTILNILANLAVLQLSRGAFIYESRSRPAVERWS
ncbi:AAA domain-containing protein [Paenibacillus albidus]|uniref:AAA domain-containing protein n=1 Tax=Paenibacillus albidus TaxID=2041023 RepID=UPI0016638F1C|nr:AAA domain-containing protein [Paenibacillus albidus]